jgi:hypothetical protein
MRPSLAAGLFWTSVACCAIAQLYILRSIGGSRHLAETTPGVPRERRSVAVLWAMLPAVALAVLLFFTWRAVRAPRAETMPAQLSRDAR